MLKKTHMLTYFIVAFSLLSIGYTGSYFSDVETSIGNTFIAGTWPTCPPYKPTNPNPENNTIGIGINPMLSVYVSDPNNDILDVSFYDASDDSLIDTVTDVESNTMASVIWHGIDYGVTYEWYVVAEDYEGSTQSDTWRFTTNHPPDIPSLVSPTNNSEGVGLSPTLKLHVSDPDEDAMNVSFYDASDNQLIGTNVNVADGGNASITWNDLSYSHTYTWYVIVDDSMIETQSDTWIFTTKPRPSGGGGSNPPSNNPPTAIAGGPYYGNVSEPTVFNGSSSFDSDGTIVSYYWDFDDGTNSTDVTTIHHYINIGIYDVTLTVTDDDGATDSDTTTVTITGLLLKNITATPNTQNTGEPVNITCNITNTSRLVDVTLNITYPNGNNTVVSIYQNHMANTSLYYYNEMYNLSGIYEYFIYAYDIENNTAISQTYQFRIEDLTLPEISNVTTTPQQMQEINGYINITAAVTDNNEVKEVFLNITYPDNSTINISMVHINGTVTYYYNSTYPDMGDYKFFILAADTNNNTATSNIYHFSIVDLQPPTIVDNTPETAYKNHSFIFNATVTDNNIVANVYVEYCYETENHTNVSMNNIDEDSWNKTITIPSNFDILHYIIHAKDTSNNWNHTEIKSITLLENN